MTITPPATLTPGQKVTLSGKAGWLMCDPNTCVPGKADLSITLEVGAAAAPSPEATAIEAAVAKLPSPVAAPMKTALEGANVVLTATIPAGSIPEGAKLAFHPLKNQVLDPFADPSVTVAGETVTISGPKHESLTAAPAEFAGVLAVEVPGKKTGFELSTSGVTAAAAPTATEHRHARGRSWQSARTKIFRRVNTRGTPLRWRPFRRAPRRLPRRHHSERDALCLPRDLAEGNVLRRTSRRGPEEGLRPLRRLRAGHSRLLLGPHDHDAVIKSASGGEVGWGAQLQFPRVVIGLIVIMVLVAMSLFGVFEIGASMTAVGGDLANKSGYAGSFWSGALAVLLATPCTAPLMAPAIGFALSQSAPVMFLVFTTLGLGLAAPYFLFAIFPKLLDVLPAPGAWMETFKQFMGFPMLAVVVWLSGVLSKQLNTAGLQWALASVLLVALAGWIYGRFGGFNRSTTARMKGRLTALLVFLVALGVAWDASAKRPPANTIDIADVIAKHRAEGKHVFVDFTAEWCVTCKVNKRVAINTETVQSAFKENNVAFVTADWTNEDPSITKLLAEFGRAGVPFYLLYPADTSKEPIRFGDGILTQGAILEAIGKL